MSGLHRFFGLATTPTTGLRHESRFPILSTTPTGVHASSSTTSRCQVRGRTQQDPSDNAQKSVGTRVGRASLGRPEAPIGVNDKEYMVSPAHGSIYKRSLQKAIRQAAVTGSSTYRGKKMFTNVNLKLPKGVRQSEAGGQRVHVFSWNCSGLSQEVMAELMLWLQHHSHIQLVFLQETHWGQSMEWSKNGWHFVHSASGKPNSAGVLTGIRESFATADTISWHEAIPGRLLQVRCFSGTQHLDLVNCYQHAMAYGTNEKLEALYGKRRGFWKALSKLLCSFPFRSQMIMGGDFNCSLETESRIAGFGVIQGSQVKQARQDRDLFMDVLRNCTLSALNTWPKKRSTYTHPRGSSQIDFILVRQQSADAGAKRAQPTQTVLAGWRSSGHSPLQASVPLIWQPWRGPAKTVPVTPDAVHGQLGFCMENGVRQMYQQMLATQTARARAALPALEGSDGNILSLWALRKRLMCCSPCGVGGFFRAFREVTRFLRAKRELRKTIRSKKRQQLLDSLQLVEDAANRVTTTGMYEYVKLLCPKTRRQRIRLRSEDGSLVTKQQECEMLAEHAGGLWKSKRPQPELPPLLPIAGEILGAEAWASAIKKIPSVKAVPMFTPLVTTWKQSLRAVSEQLANISWCSLSSSHPFILKEWTSVQIAWLPKPGKSPSQPAHLRSIGLMSVDQKSLLHIIKGHLKPHMFLGICMIVPSMLTGVVSVLWMPFYARALTVQLFGVCLRLILPTSPPK